MHADDCFRMMNGCIMKEIGTEKYKTMKRSIDAWRTRGAVAPSSSYLVRKMTGKIEYDKDLALLQLGFGEGVFTKEIIRRMTLGSTIVVFEVDTDCRKYMLADARITYIEDSAENISKHFGTQEFDHIISTLPFGSLPRKVSVNIFEEIEKHLKSGGKFLQFQYSLLSKKDIARLFGQDPKIDFELRNLPPAFIYEVEKK